MAAILIVDDERAIRMMLTDFLENTYEVFSAENAAKALAFLENRKVDLLISDINMPGMNGIELLRTVRPLYPAMKTALITAYNINEYVQLAKNESITNIIPKTVPFNFPELEAIVKGLISGEIFSLQRYLLPEHTILGEFKVTSSANGRDVREEIAGLFSRTFGTSGDMRLVLDELITNAIYHAPAFENGVKKYPIFTEVTLSPDEHIGITCGYDGEKYGAAVVDLMGRLRKETVLDKMNRQLSGVGLLDESGRGLHMSRIFADRMIINIQRGKKTEIVALNYFSPTYRGYKPLYINEL